jgi:serine phosphatase RsbU (regulator of sigma subunit)
MARFKAHERVIFFRSPRGHLLAAPFVPPSIPREDGHVFGISTEGILLMSSLTSGVDRNNIARRPSVQLAFQSGLTEGTTTIQVGGDKLVVAYFEIPKSNVIIFAEMSMNVLMAPFYQAVRIWLIFGFVIVLVGAIFAFYAVKRLAYPARLATGYLMRLADGDFSSRPSYQNRDEFLNIFSGIEFLAKNILIRENRLRLVGHGMETILQEAGPWESDLTMPKFRYSCARIINKILGVHKPSAIYVWTPDGEDKFQNENQVLVLANEFEQKKESANREQSKDEKIFEFNVVSRDARLLMRLKVFNVAEGQLWPETQQTINQFCESVSSYFDRRVAWAEHLSKLQQDKEISIAASIQKSLVSFPESSPGVELAHHYIPASSVGGDWTSAFYDESSKVLRFFMGDVTGHGIAPSLVTVIAAGVVKTFLRLNNTARAAAVDGNGSEVASLGDISEADFLQRLSLELNAVVLDAGENRIAMTLMMGSLHVETGELTLCNLGHPSPVAVGGGGSHASQLARIVSRSYLGTDLFVTPQVSQLKLEPGQGLMLFTDGLIENFDKAVKKRELMQLGKSASSADGMLSAVQSAYHSATVDKGTPNDDVAILVVLWKGPDTSVSEIDFS